jgi:hypothetical protein
MRHENNYVRALCSLLRVKSDLKQLRFDFASTPEKISIDLSL